MSSPDADASRTGLSPRRVALQIIGFVAGIGLLAWCIHGALPRDDAARAGWENLRHADPWLIAALIACTAASAVINGLTFQVLIRPLRPISGADLQRLNLVANLLNYAPIRLGLISRVAWHLRVDRLSVVQIGGWFAVIGCILVIGTGASFVATLARPQLDLLWGALVLGFMAIGLTALRLLRGGLLKRHGRGVDRILGDPSALWIAGLLRLADIAAYWGRMSAAAAILGIELGARSLFVLGITAFAASLVPFGRVGFREFTVAAAAGWIGMESAELDANMQQLALLDSAGEFLFYLPAGAVLLPWFRSRLMRAGREEAETGGGAVAGADADADADSDSDATADPTGDPSATRDTDAPPRPGDPPVSP